MGLSQNPDIHNPDNPQSRYQNPDNSKIPTDQYPNSDTILMVHNPDVHNPKVYIKKLINIKILVMSQSLQLINIASQI